MLLLVLFEIAPDTVMSLLAATVCNVVGGVIVVVGVGGVVSVVGVVVGVVGVVVVVGVVWC